MTLLYNDIPVNKLGVYDIIYCLGASDERIVCLISGSQDVQAIRDALSERYYILKPLKVTSE